MTAFEVSEVNEQESIQIYDMEEPHIGKTVKFKRSENEDPDPLFFLNVPTKVPRNKTGAAASRRSSVSKGSNDSSHPRLQKAHSGRTKKKSVNVDAIECA